jgi:hypothetical protein
MNPLEFAKAHPVEVGIGVFGAGLLFILLTSHGSSGGTTDASAYYAAEAATAQSGNQLAAIQDQDTAQTAQTLITANAAQNIQTTWANADTTINSQNTQAQIATAPYAAEVGLGGDIAQVAALPPLTTTTTNQSKNNGLFGLFGSSSNSVTTSQQANPNATTAIAQLTQLLQNGFVAPH